MQDLTRFVYRKERLYAPGGPFFGVRVIRGLTNPSHRAGAIHIFKHLRYHHRRFDPDEVQAWAMENGWTDEDVALLGQYAAGVAAGKRYHTQPDPFGRHAYDHWCEQAGEAP